MEKTLNNLKLLKKFAKKEAPKILREMNYTYNQWWTHSVSDKCACMQYLITVSHSNLYVPLQYCYSIFVDPCKTFNIRDMYEYLFGGPDRIRHIAERYSFPNNAETIEDFITRVDVLIHYIKELK